MAGCNQISVDIDRSTTLEQIVQLVAKQTGAPLRDTLLDDRSSIRSSILVFLDDELVAKDNPLNLREGSELIITTLISGG